MNILKTTELYTSNECILRYMNYISIKLFLKYMQGASLVAEWLGIRLQMQGTWVRALVQEDPTCRQATKPVLHNY